MGAHEGTAIENLYKSDRVLIGGENTISVKKAVDAIVSIYKKWIPENKILKTNISIKIRRVLYYGNQN